MERVRKLNHIENEMPDDSLVWEKLQKRIKRQPKKKILAGWLVAASVITLLFLPATLKEKQQDIHERTTIVNAMPPKILVRSPHDPSVRATQVTVSKKEKGSSVIARNRKRERLPEPVLVKEKIEAKQFAIDNSLITVNKEIPGVIFKTQNNIAAEKKALRIIHANELAGESGSTLDMIPYRKFMRRPDATVKKNNLKPDHTIVNF